MTERLSLPDVRALAADCLVRAGVARPDAEEVAAEVEAAEAAGDRHNGMEALLRDLRLLRYGRIEPVAVPLAAHPKPGLLRLDAAHGFAAAALAGAMGTLCEMATRQGIAMLRLERASDPGRMYCTARRLAAQGLAVLMARPEDAAAPAAHMDKAIAAMSGTEGDTLTMLVPPSWGGQPADSPLGHPVAHATTLIAFDPEVTGPALSCAVPAPGSTSPLREEIACSTELLEQIVTA